MSGFEQHPASSAADRAWDVAVVGAGPAGATAALRLAGNGHRVALLDEGRFPRDKVCGDGLSGRTIHLLKEVGAHERVLAVGTRLGLASVFSPSLVEVRVPSDFITIRRRDLDALLAERAVEAGAIFFQGRVRGVEATPSEASLSVVGCGERIRARYCLVATGADIALARRLGMIAEPRPSAVAVRRYVRSRHPLDRLVGFYDRAAVPGYGWIFPMGDGLFNVGVILFRAAPGRSRWDIRGLYARFTEAFPLAREVVRSGEESFRLEGGTLRCGLKGCRALSRGRVLLAGEVAGTTLPFTAEGIGQAMESGLLAADTISAALVGDRPETLDGFAEKLERSLGKRHRGHETAQRWLAVPWVNDLVARRIVQSPGLRRALAGMVTEGKDPRDVFSLRAVLGSLWG